MFNIYNVSRKMITLVDSNELFELSIEFLERSFPDSEFFIFKYDGSNNRFSVLYNKKSILEEVLFHFGVNIKRKWKENFIANNKVMLLDREKDTDHTYYEFLPNHVRFLLFIPLLKEDKNIQVAVVMFKNNNYVPFINLEYLDIFYKQMNLGLVKINMYEQIQEKSIRDSLTNLYRRTFLEERFDYEIKRCIRENTSMAILMIDIDFFKSYNDKYGHLLGDKVLALVADILTKSLYDTDVIARYGGEEFIVLMPRVNREESIAKAERVRQEIENTQFFDDIEQRVTISIGVSCFPEDGITKDVLIEKADNALYYAKNNGRNVVVDYLEVQKVLN